ncbi:Trp biosynthesis-associated membrane protein [Cellulomonas palmilytica]|uniref:Trp biosynthesis-associated membrane protein n=1 Tax=Cellulomonas palmilytica TaxID=2608402 RepID=UPI001F23CE15|nr:Trp biosynthesis-associated membrane protein [Cellulomonas palmilytica]UJP38919.1 Trp biosynthesis-associated membrane protein [Cellulomonas palmilytica]
MAETPRRAGRGRAAGLLVLAAGLTGLVAVVPWLTVDTTTVLGVPRTISVSGSSAAPSLVAAALVLLAAAGAVALVGRAGRWVVAGAVALAGALVVVDAVGVLRAPVDTAAPRVVEELGLERALEAAVSPWPWVAVVVGVLDVLLAVWLVRASAAWSTGRRHESGTTDAPPAGRGGAPLSERDQWDALTRGDDPTEGSDGVPRADD